MATGMEKKEIDGASDIFWSREPIMGPKGTKEKPAIVPSFNTSRVVGLETEQVHACATGVRAAARAASTPPPAAPIRRPPPPLALASPTASAAPRSALPPLSTATA